MEVKPLFPSVSFFNLGLRMADIVNKPEVSKFIARMYEVLAALIAALMALFIYLGVSTPMGTLGILAVVTLSIVEVVMLLLLRSLYQTRYLLTQDNLVIRTTRLIGGEKIIPLKTVESIERTLIPFGIRLFGASFHGGYYQIPGLGRAFLAITNFKDGLLIKTRLGNYIITPKNPESFKEVIEVKTCL